MSDVADTLSLPEALLLIRQDNRRQMEQLRYHTQSRALANAAIWSKSSLRALERFERKLTEEKHSTAGNSSKNLAQRYEEAGIPIRHG